MGSSLVCCKVLSLSASYIGLYTFVKVEPINTQILYSLAVAVVVVVCQAISQ